MVGWLRVWRLMDLFSYFFFFLSPLKLLTAGQGVHLGLKTDFGNVREQTEERAITGTSRDQLSNMIILLSAGRPV